MIPRLLAERVRGRVRDIFSPLIVIAFAAIAGTLISSGAILRPFVAVSVAFLLVVGALSEPRAFLCALVGWLTILGLLRRLLSALSPALPQGDPLLLVSALVWVALAMMSFRSGALRGRTRLSRAVLALSMLLIASALNPLQGSLAIGFGGLLLVSVPMLAFWIGRRLVSDRALMRIFHLLWGLSCLAAVYGLAQSFVGLPSWDSRWVLQSGYVALNVGGTTRAFASFSSAAEYATFLGVGLVVSFAWVLKRTRVLLLAAPIGLLAIAIWFESARGIIVLLVVAVCLMAGASRGLSLTRSILGGVAILGLLPLLIGHIAPTDFGQGTSSRLAAHQVLALKDPLGSGSTLPLHFRLISEGVRQGLVNPLGRGLGTVTIAAGKFGGTSSGTEGDPGNAAIAAGLLGFIAYVFVFLLGFRAVYRLAADRRDVLSLVALGVLLATLLQWLNGGQYAVAFLPWLVLGWADSRARENGSSSTWKRAR